LTLVCPPPVALPRLPATQLENILLELHWEARCDPVIMVVPAPFVPPVLPEAALAVTPEATTVSLELEHDAPGPETVLCGAQSVDWMRLAKTALFCVVFRDELDVSVPRSIRSNEVALARLPIHVKRVKVAAKRDLNFWVWRWVLLNFGRAGTVLPEFGIGMPGVSDAMRH